MNLASTAPIMHLVRPHFDSYPNYCLPFGHSIRTYQAGDQETWLRIQREASPLENITRDLYIHEFGDDPEILARHQLFLCDAAGDVIGTATARIDPNYFGGKWGKVCWLAVVPSHQLQGLAKPLFSAVMDCLAGLGCARAYSILHFEQIPAIRLCLRFGFLPVVRNGQDELAWDSIRFGLIHPGLRFEFFRE